MQLFAHVTWQTFGLQFWKESAFAFVQRERVSALLDVVLAGASGRNACTTTRKGTLVLVRLLVLVRVRPSAARSSRNSSRNDGLAAPIVATMCFRNSSHTLIATSG
eukprot:scaffold472696_cov37-Prasinocladus_malaysianus.AAC.1